MAEELLIPKLAKAVEMEFGHILAVEANRKEQTMSRYIKFDDAVKIMACEMYAEAQSQGYDVDGIEDFMPEAKAWITDAPSIDIVFCEECHWARPRSLPGETGYRCVFHRIWKGENGFCDSGEREGE